MTDTAPHTRNGVHVHASFQYVRCDLSPELISHYSTAAQAEAVAAPKAEQAEGVTTPSSGDLDISSARGRAH